MKHCQVEVQEKYFWKTFSKSKKILLIMISNTIEMLIIVYSNKFLDEKKTHLFCKKFTFVYGPF